MMRGLVIFLAGSAATFAASLLARHFLVPDIVPVGWAAEPQALWAVEAAFLLRATELIAIGTTIFALLAIASQVLHRDDGAPSA
jgi:hypothetical protein